MRAAHRVSATKRPLRLVPVRLLERGLRHSGRRLGVALVYHSLADAPGDPDRQLVPPHGADLFEEQLRYLQARYRIVPAEELLDAARARRRGDRYPVAVTFDDDLGSHVEVALPILRRLGVHATFFLCGASLERPHSFWWERLQRAADRGADLTAVTGAPTGIHAVAQRIELETPQVRSQLAERLLEVAGDDPPDAGLRAADVRVLARAGQGIGFHTRRHDRLPELPDEELASALTEGRSDLEELIERPLTAISYPHGRADDRVAAAAGAAGFTLGFTGTGKPVAASSDPLLLRRIEPAHTDAGTFARQLALAILAAHR